MYMEEEVKRGVALLDRQKPDWRKTDFSNIDMRNPRKCVLGKIYGHFATGVKELGLGSVVRATHFGFSTRPTWHLLDETHNKDWADLTGTWEAILNERK